MEDKILVVIKEPGKDPRVEPLFPNKLKAFQDEVGGYIETVSFGALVIICNEHGRIMDLPFNAVVGGVSFCGTIIAAGVKEDKFVSITAANVPAVLRMLK